MKNKILKLAALLIAMGPLAAQASVIYTYTGNTFDGIDDFNPPIGTYDTTMSVSGSFTVAAPLLSNSFSDIGSLILNFTFNDGRGTLDGSNSTLTSAFLAVDSTGAPTRWEFIAGNGVILNLPTDIFRSITTRHTDDIGRFFQCNPLAGPPFTSIGCLPTIGPDRGRVISNPGNWVITGFADPSPPTVPPPVPEPTTLLLLGLGLAGMGFARKRLH